MVAVNMSPRDLSGNGTEAEIEASARVTGLVAALKAARVLVQDVQDAIADRPEMVDDELHFSHDTDALLQQIDEALGAPWTW